MQFTLVHDVEVHSPEPLGKSSVLLAGEKIAKVGSLEPDDLARLGLGVHVLSGTDYLAVPGFIDPHAHLIGAGGEEGFASRMPEVLVSQLVSAGVTTVVGLLGTDTTTRHIASLHAKASQLWEEGLTAYMYTGGFELPPSTLTDSVLNDLVLIDKVIGTGEIAISDPRWIDPPLEKLAHVVAETSLGGKMAAKAGVTHFHVGPAKGGVQLLHQLLDSYELDASKLYATHINRSESLLGDAIVLAKRGAYVDMDTVEEDIVERLRYYQSHGGPPDRLTISSDAHTPKGSTRKLYEQFVACVRDHAMPIAEVLPHFTRNAATALALKGKGTLSRGSDADLLLLHKETFEIVHVFARGHHLVSYGDQVSPSKQEAQVQAGKE